MPRSCYPAISARLSPDGLSIRLWLGEVVVRVGVNVRLGLGLRPIRVRVRARTFFGVRVKVRITSDSGYCYG